MAAEPTLENSAVVSASLDSNDVSLSPRFAPSSFASTPQLASPAVAVELIVSMRGYSRLHHELIFLFY